MQQVLKENATFYHKHIITKKEELAEFYGYKHEYECRTMKRKKQSGQVQYRQQQYKLFPHKPICVPYFLLQSSLYHSNAALHPATSFDQLPSWQCESCFPDTGQNLIQRHCTHFPEVKGYWAGLGAPAKTTRELIIPSILIGYIIRCLIPKSTRSTRCLG